MEVARRSSNPLPSRSRPYHGVFTSQNAPTIVFITVCTKNRQPWLATRDVHLLLHTVWREADSWLVGRYVLMPDHVHLFAAPHDGRTSLDSWMRFWKSQFIRRHGRPEHRWQAGYWDTRLRRGESYEAKWDYVLNNPVRRSLVKVAEDWEFQEVVNDLPW